MSSSDLFEPGDLFNGYIIQDEREQREGPLQCYFSTHTRTNQTAMLHCLDCRPVEHTPEKIERFLEMVAHLRSLSIEHIGRVYDGGVTDRVYWLATEYDMTAPTLESILGDPNEKLPVQACILVAAQLAIALRDAGAAGIRHLRLHPGLIVLSRETQCLDKVFDIGVAELFGLSPAVIRLEPNYAAPEQLRDKGRPIDERADIYAFGMIFYAMLVWNRPYADKDGALPSPSKLLLLTMTQTPPLVAERRKPFPDFLDVFVQRMVAKNRKDRPLGWNSLYKELTDIAGRWIVWCDAMNELGSLEPAKRDALAAALRGPAPEGSELHVLVARLLETTLLGSSVNKPHKPQSGKRPSAALRAAMEGYTIEDDEGSAHGEPEPEWLATLPEEPEPALPESALRAAAVASACRSPDAVEPPALEEPPRGPLGPPATPPHGQHSPAPLAAPASPPCAEPGTPPPEAQRRPVATAEPVICPAPPLQLEQAAIPQDVAPPEPVTLPSPGQLAQHDHPRAARRAPRTRAALTVAALFTSSAVAMVLSHGAGERATVARSAVLRGLHTPDQHAEGAMVEPVGPVPSVPAAEMPRAKGTAQPPLAPPSASARSPIVVPTATPTAAPTEEDPCEIFYCLKDDQ